MYRADAQTRRKGRRRKFWIILLILLLAVLLVAGLWLRRYLQPKTVIKQATAVTAKVNYAAQTKVYNEPDFSISLPVNWLPIPRPPGPYQSYTWQISDSGTNGQQIEIYEDTIPVNFAVNRALIVSGEVDHLQVEGTASDNCSQYTTTKSEPNQFGAPARWQGVDFLCDQQNPERDTIGTSSTDGINTVLLKSPSTGRTHKFFFTYTNHSMSPDYSVFYAALQSFQMN